jgi:hypothetical protein
MDKPFHLDGEREFFILFIEVPFISLILLPDQSNFRDNRFLVDDVEEGELKKMKKGFK